MRDGWEIKKLGDVCESDLGKTLNQATDTGELQPYLCAINVLWDRIELSTVKQTKFEKSEMERYSVRKGDLLICEGGDIGRAAIWDKEEPMLYQNALHRVRFDGSVLPRFCLLYLRSLKDAGILDSRYGKGVTIKHLVKSSLLSIPIPVPPLSEQERIVAELDCLSSIIEKQKQQLKEYDTLAQSIFYDMFGDPITNDKGWEIKKLEEVCESDLGKTLNKSIDTGDLLPYLCSINVLWGKVELSVLKEARFEPTEIERYSVKKGDLLVCEGGDIGRAAIWESDSSMLYQNALHRLRFKGTILPIYCLFNLKHLKDCGDLDSKYGKGVTIKHLVKSSLYSIPIPVPPLTLQQQFAEKIEAIEKQKAILKKNIEETELLFNSRMDYYFN
ncbi:MAG: restriction endonuclease subunit S [Bacteroidaceae bacterium]|nr:restriction endonuclease subunit S [Bacteroidaceae bacterium]